MLLKGDEGGCKIWRGVALRVTGTVPLPLGDPSTQRSMNRVVAQQELERQNFRVRGSGGDAVFRPAARWLRHPGDNDPPPPPHDGEMPMPTTPDPTDPHPRGRVPVL